MTLFGKVILFCSILIIACSGPEKSPKTSYDDIINFESARDNDTINVPKIHFESTHYDYGTVLQGEKVEHEFHFRNTGKENLLILDTKSSCGCTVSDYEEGPIAPGKTSTIKLVFDTSEKMGLQEKKVTIFTNTIPNKYYLNLTGKVIEK